MRSLVYYGTEDLRLVDSRIPEPGPGEVRVAVAACGVCGSDAAELDHGPVLTRPPVILGHEFVGVVDAVGEGVDDFSEGARVVCGAGVSCGECEPCGRGRTNLCDSYRTAGLTIDGGLAEYVVVPREILHDVSESTLTLDTLALTQPMAIAVHAARQGAVGADDVVAIVGAGGIGTFLTAVAVQWARRVIVLDIDDDRLELARRLGAQATFNPARGDAGALVDELRSRIDTVFEVSGTASGFATALSLLRRGGTLVPVGIQRSDIAAPLGEWTVREISVVGTNALVFAEDIPDAVRLLEASSLWDMVAPEVITLEQTVAEGLDPLRRGTSSRIKTLVDPAARRPRRAVHSG
ncbi:zinc-dependent alcohol dehydrogenase [Microcella pacifica]|uniref:Alcohol dehydrogenase catalytic domain-containing protein n=1 Tax=Microcella pacifica TaxID=2591847 RepID=A0A9E5JPL1_9MICO|nr:alcohol dehydrogenase catalytic domain-containing protein [Microcella pacifica]NHF62572.1 alcohol dehydrogenase catalytic domain-containing protein [Microcella pacifica]